MFGIHTPPYTLETTGTDMTVLYIDIRLPAFGIDFGAFFINSKAEKIYYRMTKFPN